MEKSKYKNEEGTLLQERHMEVSAFIIKQQEKGIYEMSSHISDFAESKETEISLKNATIEQLEEMLKIKRSFK